MNVRASAVSYPPISTATAPCTPSFAVSAPKSILVAASQSDGEAISRSPSLGLSAPATSPLLEGLWPQRSGVQRIDEGLYITNYFGAKSLSTLRAANITHVLVCAGELPEMFPEHFAYRRLKDLYDGSSHAFGPALLAALPWASQAIEQGGRVVLHCAAGISRSGAVAVAYVMWSRGVSADTALQIVRLARPIVSPNGQFMELLRALDVNLLGPPPLGGSSWPNRPPQITLD